MSDRVMVIAAHPDDETLGSGATIAKHCKAGDAVSIIALADGVTARGISLGNSKERHGMFRKACAILGTEDVWIHQYPDNRMDTVPLLDIVKHIEKHLQRFKPTIVYTHYRGDLNVDHRITYQAVRVACRPQPGQMVRKLLCFEVPCSTTWAGNFLPNYFIDVSETFETKIAACECYGDEIRPWPHARSIAGIRSLALWRGMSVGMMFAESFIVERIVA